MMPPREPDPYNVPWGPSRISTACMSTRRKSGSGPLYPVRMSPKYCPTGDCVGPLKLESAIPRMNSLLRPAPRWVDEKPTDRASIASAPATLLFGPYRPSWSFPLAVKAPYYSSANAQLSLTAPSQSQSSLTLSQARQLNQAIETLRAGDIERATAEWTLFIENQANAGGTIDVNTLVQLVLREAYLSSTEDLRFYAEKVRYFNQAKKQIRDALAHARAVEATLAIATLKSKMEAHITALETRLNSLGDDAQLANVDLQNILQKQQQTLQMMSNISKMLYDTAQSVIRKMGG